MAYCKIEEIPELIKKMGDGFYKIKIRNGNVETFWTEKNLSKQEIEELLKKEEV